MPWRVAVVALLLVTAGCQFYGGGPATQPADGGTVTEKSPTDNPWGTPTLTVAVANDAGEWRNVTGAVADALAYWDRNRALAGYQVDFELEPGATDPDVLVRYVESVGACGSTDRDGEAGYAPLIDHDNPPDPPAVVCIRTGYTESSTERLLRHEFGHLLGLGHDDPPRELMGATSGYLATPRPSPAVLEASVADGNLTVAVDRSTLFARREKLSRDQFAAVYDYFERGASETVDRSVTIEEVANPAEADVVVAFPDQATCEPPNAGSCAHLERRADGTSQLHVTISTTHEDTFGWHAGFWLAIALGVDRHAELPAPLRNASFEERFGGWWEQAE